MLDVGDGEWEEEKEKKGEWGGGGVMDHLVSKFDEKHGTMYAFKKSL